MYHSAFAGSGGEGSPLDSGGEGVNWPEAKNTGPDQMSPTAHFARTPGGGILRTNARGPRISGSRIFGSRIFGGSGGVREEAGSGESGIPRVSGSAGIPDIWHFRVAPAENVAVLERQIAPRGFESWPRELLGTLRVSRLRHVADHPYNGGAALKGDGPGSPL